MKKPKSLRLVAVISDVHCGSTVGLMPPGFTTLRGNEIKQNPVQAWIWECWLRANAFIAEVADGEPYALIINGDVIEGNHHGTKETISADNADHLNCAIDVLTPAANRAAKTFIVTGTECHTGSTEATLGKVLKAERNPDSHDDPAKQVRVFDRLDIDFAGIRCAFAHHIGTSQRSYTEATQFAIALNEEQIAAVRNGDPVPRVIGRAHRHKFGYFENNHGLCVVSPPFQGLTRFGYKVVPHERSHPGVYLLDWRSRVNGSLPQLHSQTYDTPKRKGIAA